MECDKCSSFALQFIGQVIPKKSTMVGYILRHWIGVPPAPNSSTEFGADFNKIMYDWFLVEAFCLIAFSKNVTTMNSKATGQKKSEILALKEWNNNEFIWIKSVIFLLKIELKRRITNKDLNFGDFLFWEFKG